MTEQVANTVTGNLNGSIDAVVTAATLVDASAFPSSGDFRLKVDDELMLVTGVAGNVLTVTRGIESTTAAAHADGRAARMVLSAAALTTIIGEQASVAAVVAEASAYGVLDLTTAGALVSVTADLAAGKYLVMGTYVVTGNTGYGSIRLRKGGTGIGDQGYARYQASNIDTRTPLNAIVDHAGGSDTWDIYYSSGTGTLSFGNADARFPRAIRVVRIGDI